MQVQFILYIDCASQTFLYSFTSSSRFYWALLIRNNFAFSIPIWMSFYFFFCLMVLVKASSTVLDRNDWSRHSYIVSDLKMKAFSLSLFTMMLAVSLYSCPLSGRKHFYLFFVYWVFLSWKVCGFFQIIFQNQFWSPQGFFFYSITVVYHIKWLFVLIQICIPRINPTWSNIITFKCC